MWYDFISILIIKWMHMEKIMKRRRSLSLFLLLVLVLLVTGCSTTIKLSYMKPAEVNMGKYRNIAIASTVPYDGKISLPMLIRTLDPTASSVRMFSTYKSDIPNSIATYATNQIVSKLSSTGFFNSILDPKDTDTILNMRNLGYDPSAEFKKHGYDAVMIPKIENMGYDEYIWTEVKEKKVYDSTLKKEVVKKETVYNIKRVANITLSITVLDCNTNQLVAKKTFKDSAVWTASFNPKSYSFTIDALSLFRSMISDMQYEILEKFIPARAAYYADLMKNKPELEFVSAAYDFAEEGNMDAAVEIFGEAWELYGHVPSGYNYALLMAGYGEYDIALDVLKKLRYSSSDSRITELYGDLIYMKDKNEKANAQLEGLDSDASGSNGKTTNTIYDFILN